MATLLSEDQVDRPVGVGYEGQGPDVNLPSVESQNNQQDGYRDGSLHITVHPENNIAGQSVTEEPTSDTGNNNWSQIQEALSQGYSREEIAKYMQQNLGVSPEEADKQVIGSVQDKIKTAKDQGYTDEEVKQYLISNKYDPNIVNSAIKLSQIDTSWKASNYDPRQQVSEAQDISTMYQNIYSKYSTMGKQLAGFANPEMAREARIEINQLNASIVDRLKKDNFDAFINPESGDVMMRDQNGIEHEVDSTFLKSMYAGKGEFASAIAGGIAGARLGAMAPGRAKPFTTAAGVLLGSMAGASIGKAADMTVNAAILKEDLDSNLYMTQMKQAGIFDGVASILAGGIFKLGIGGAKQIMKAYDFALAGNTKGAYKALLENMQISDEQAKAIVAQWEKFNEISAPGRTAEEKAISVITSTQQGSESLVKYSAAKDPQLANTIVSDIDKRAKSLIHTIDNVQDENIGKFVREDLARYQKDVKDFYTGVKQIGADAIDGTDFRFDLDKTALEPVLNKIGKNITNPAKKEQYLLYMSRIENASKGRTFTDLLDLRAAVNDFKYSKSGLSKSDLEALNSVLNKIDSQVSKAVKEYMPNNGKQWLADFGKAKTEYAKMKRLETNILVKYISRKSSTEAGIQKVLSRFGTDKDVDTEVFNQLVEKLTPATRVKVEGAAVKNLTNKYTLGELADKQAIHFPALSDALSELNITTTQGKHLVSVVDEMAKVFKNDVALSRISGNLALPKNQTYLSKEILPRIHMEIMSRGFNAVKRFLPGKESRNIALIHKINKLLKNPLHVKTAEDLIRSFPKEDQPEIISLVKQLQIETAKNPATNVVKDFKPMYKQTKSGKLTTSDGALGKGVYLVDKVKNPDPASKVIKHEVNLSQMATLEDISALVGREVTVKDVRTIPDLQKLLVEKGFKGIKVEGKAMLFPETTLGVKVPKVAPKVVEENITKSISSDPYDKLLNNKSITVYHGTLQKFDLEKPLAIQGDRVYVSTDKEYAELYAKIDPEGPTVGKIHNFDIKGNFISLDDDKFKTFITNMFQPKDIRDFLYEVSAGSLSDKENKIINSFLRSNGYDGIVNKADNEISILPERLKSIINNAKDTKKNMNKQELDKVLTERSTKELNRMGQIIKKLNDPNISLEELQKLRLEASDMGYNVYKRAPSGTSKNSTGLGHKWTYAKKKGK